MDLPMAISIGKTFGSVTILLIGVSVTLASSTRSKAGEEVVSGDSKHTLCVAQVKSMALIGCVANLHRIELQDGVVRQLIEDGTSEPTDCGGFSKAVRWSRFATMQITLERVHQASWENTAQMATACRSKIAEYSK